MKEACALCQQQLEATAATMKQAYDRKAKTPTFQIGDIVTVRKFTTKVGESSKFQPNWQGTFQIQAMDETGSYGNKEGTSRSNQETLRN